MFFLVATMSDKLDVLYQIVGGIGDVFLLSGLFSMYRHMKNEEIEELRSELESRGGFVQ